MMALNPTTLPQEGGRLNKQVKAWLILFQYIRR